MHLLFICSVAFLGSVVADNDDTVWTVRRHSVVPVLITKNGYTVETHHVTTEDGYILGVHRIPATPTSPAAYDKPVVFMMHGLSCSSASWVLAGPGNGFAYVLADAGYDVWMGNARGNTYSRNHTTITDISGADFWNFSFHETGYYDLPVMIDFALETTGQKQVFFIGHSQGSTVFYVMASLRTEYNDKIKVMFSLAPIAYVGNEKNPLFRMAHTYMSTLMTIFNTFGVYELLPMSDALAAAGALFCNDDALTQVLCTNLILAFCGFNKAQLNTTLLPTILAHTSSGISTKQVVHYCQEIESGEFRSYDYGPIKNLVVYGSLTPPSYDLSLITTPVYVVYSTNDGLSGAQDAIRLYSQLGNPIELIRASDDNWNHIDYLWGVDAKKLIYDPILATIKEKYSD